MDLLSDLTPAQQEAVTHFEGPLLVLAGPGSGKTRVITRRILYLLLEHRVRPTSILAVTFTNKAAGEMRQRVWQLMPDSTKLDPTGVALPPHRFLRISTFHSFGAYFLRVYGERLHLDPRFTIYDQDDRNKVIKAALEAAEVDPARFTPERIQGAISHAKNQLLTPEKYASGANDFFTQIVAQVYPVYERKMREANAFDFDDLLLWPALALKNDPKLRADLDHRFQFVLIDEYQDTNQAQYAIARGLSIDRPNLCVVGDPDQSIYKWRGSDIQNILNFEKDFPGTRVITLEKNYRSTKAILSVAAHLISHNHKRKPKELTTDNPSGQPVTVITYPTGLDEADGIVRRIKEAVETGKRRFRDFAIFMRINALSRALESACISQRVAYQIVRGLAFFDRKENRDVLAYLRLLLNPRDNFSFLRVVNEPPRGIGKVSLAHLQAYAEPRELSLLSASAKISEIPAIKGKAAVGLRDFAKLMHDLLPLAEAPPDDVIRQVIDRTGYRQMYLDSMDEGDQERLANIEEFITAAQQFTKEDSSATLADFLENITLSSDVDSWDEDQDCVSIMTLHAAKGLEFPVVFMIAVEEGLLPHERSRENNDDIEEERRLAFVGMTRAKEELYLSHSGLREFRGMARYAIASQFLDQLPTESIERVDLSENREHVMNEWRSGSPTAEESWRETGINHQQSRIAPESGRKGDTETTRHGDEEIGRAAHRGGTNGEPAKAFVEGMLVRHEQYGQGRVTQVSGYGIMRKIKVRFSTYGEKTFVAEKAKLAILVKAK
jgi:DNA helicase-2/ATP-dependent DNA helicase PcrA